MKILFWTGMAVLILGIGSIFVPVPRGQREGFSYEGVSAPIETSREQVMSPFLSAVMIMGGLAAMVAAKLKT
ncbi:MAG TPA: hypothetical protein VN893_08595 [Bryobacteraceae bacterium]|nr:hypothetical protein [Bryobacteraceae bacterium]